MILFRQRRSYIENRERGLVVTVEGLLQSIQTQKCMDVTTVYHL